MNKQKILIVEDDGIIRERMKRILEKWKFTVIETDRGKKAVNLAGEFRLLIVTALAR